MAFYRNRVTYADLSPRVQKFRIFLQQYGKLVNNPAEDGYEVYFFDAPFSNEVSVRFDREFSSLRMAEFIDIVPFFNTPNPGHLVYIRESRDVQKPTVSPTHIRLPKLSYLITLVPEDFFNILKLITTARTSATRDALSLNFPAAGMSSLTATAIEPFFTILKVNYRINADYADKKWTLRSSINAVADLEPTQLNQLYAMQYLTSLQNEDLLYFPIETAIELGLELTQINDDYCLPTREETK